MTIYKHVLKKKKKKKNAVSPTLSVSAVLHFYSVSTVHIKDQIKNQMSMMSMTRKCHNHTLQTKTRHDIILHFIKQRNQFHFEGKLYAQKCVSVSVPFVPNVVVQHVSGFVACCVEATHYKWKVSSYLWAMWYTMLVSVYAISVIL